MKICSDCRVQKTLDNYGIKISTNDGLQYSCKQCRAIINKKDYLKRKDSRLKSAKNYYDLNKESILNKRNQIDHSEYNKSYKQENKDNIKQYNKQYNELNKEKIKLQRAKYRKENRAKLQAYENNKMKTDILFKLGKRLRNRLQDFLKGRNFIDDRSFNDYLGCSLEELKTWLETKFTVGMDWNNYGVWHLDHKVPLSSAKTEEEMYTLCHYTNIQPLWGIDNIKKSNKV